MGFSIKFLNAELYREEGMAPAARGILSIGDWQEEFYSSLYLWTKRDYEGQWCDAIDRLLAGETKAAFITEYLTPELSSHLVWWPAYREGRKIYLQNQLLFFDQLERPFSIEAPYESVHDHQRLSENGQSISEWSFRVEDLGAFRRMLEA